MPSFPRTPDDESARTADKAIVRLSAGIDADRHEAANPRHCLGRRCEQAELERLRDEQHRLLREIAENERQLVERQQSLLAQPTRNASAVGAPAAATPAELRRHDVQRQESLCALAGGMAHLFNNLLTIIGGHSGLAAMEAAPGSNLAHSLEEIRLATRRAAGLCRQMLDASGHSMAPRRALDPQPLLDELLASMGASQPERCRLERIPTLLPLPQVRGVAAQLRQVLTVLIQNAFEAVAGAAGVVRVVVHDVPLDTVQASLLSTPVPPGRYLCFEVSDNGCGIAPQVLPRIYEPFFSTKEIGRGLGLAVAAGIARAHGGGLIAESQPGNGAVFRLYLPALAQTAAN